MANLMHAVYWMNIMCNQMQQKIPESRHHLWWMLVQVNARYEAWGLSVLLWFPYSLMRLTEICPLDTIGCLTDIQAIIIALMMGNPQTNTALILTYIILWRSIMFGIKHGHLRDARDNAQREEWSMVWYSHLCRLQVPWTWQAGKCGI